MEDNKLYPEQKEEQAVGQEGSADDVLKAGQAAEAGQDGPVQAQNEEAQSAAAHEEESRDGSAQVQDMQSGEQPYQENGYWNGQPYQNDIYQSGQPYQNNTYQSGQLYQNSTYPNGQSWQNDRSYQNGGYQNSAYQNGAYSGGGSQNYDTGYQQYNGVQSWQNTYQNTWQSPYQNNSQMELEEPVKVSEWVLALVLMMIPCVNIIMMFVWAFSSTEKKSKSNFFKAYLIFFGISMGIMLLVWIAVVFFALMAY